VNRAKSEYLEGVMVRRTLLGAALLACGVVGMPSFAHAASSEITLDFANVINPISSDYVALFSGTTSAVTFDGYATLQDIPAGGSDQNVIISPTGSSQTVPADLGGNTPLFYAIAGVYTASSSAGTTQGVSVGVNVATSATLEGETYDQAFPGSSLVPESDVIAFLQNPNLSLLPTSLQSYVNEFSGQVSPAVIALDGTPGELVDFSDGTAGGQVDASIQQISTGPGTGGGTGTTTAVPLPASVWAALPLLGILGAVKLIRRSGSLAEGQR
jgi:hypothetical protein